MSVADVAPQNRETTPFTWALRGLESAVHEDVLHLAATLTTRVSNDGDDGDGDDETQGDMDETQGDMDEGHLQRQQARDVHDASTLQYGAHIPAQNSMHNWAPLPTVNNDDHDDGGHGDDGDEGRLRALQSRLLVPAGSLRSTAMLQAVRRHPRFSARTREYLQRYHDDREPTVAPAPTAPVAMAAAAPMLEHAVHYLSRIRHATTRDESLKCARDARLLSRQSTDLPADFLADTRTIPPPRETSWLAPGAGLAGCQHATTAASTPLPPPSRPWLSTTYSTPRSLTSYLASSAPARTHPPPPPPQPPSHPQPPPHQDRWPVKVTIHAVDWSDMSLSATMEAYNVPSHPLATLNPTHPPDRLFTRESSNTLPTHPPDTLPTHPPNTRTSITTYLEGEILDYNTHTLLTETFKSSPANDALYWRKLPPFRHMDDDDVVRALTSRRWWAALSRDWVLMRWKERCFVKSLRPDGASKTPSPSPARADPSPDSDYYLYDAHTFARHSVPPTDHAPRWVDNEHAAFDDSGCGLTISGFYYVCLRRCDGHVEGLYYDPMSSPYQCLVLESEPRARFASWAFT